MVGGMVSLSQEFMVMKQDNGEVGRRLLSRRNKMQSVYKFQIPECGNNESQIELTNNPHLRKLLLRRRRRKRRRKKEVFFKLYYC